ncbi:MAG: hypothetical protein ACLFVE_10725 [Chitinispirillaceae bacterium]
MNISVKFLFIMMMLCFLPSQGYGQSCEDLLEELEEELEPGDGDGEGDGAAREVFERPVYSVIEAGLGGGYFDDPGFESVSYNFFVAGLWEVWRYGAVRLGGEFISDLSQSFIADVTVGFRVYPYTFGTTPYAGIAAGYGYSQPGDDSGWGIHASAEAGVFIIQGPDLRLDFSVGALFQQSGGVAGGNLQGFMVRIGFVL